MGKSFAVVALIVSAFCFSSALARPTAMDNKEKFSVQGMIYCDPCRLEFETRLSYPMSGMPVTLECKKEDSDNVVYALEGSTDKYGYYSLEVEGDHEDEICMLKTDASSHPKCKDPMPNKETDRIVLTKNMGVPSPVRFVNPLGFMTHSIDSRCMQVAKDLGLDSLDSNSSTAS